MITCIKAAGASLFIQSAYVWMGMHVFVHIIGLHDYFHSLICVYFPTVKRLLLLAFFACPSLAKIYCWVHPINKLSRYAD